MQQAQRLFVALPPPAATRQALAQLQELLAPGPEARRIDTKSLHITLAFLGQTSQEKIEILQNILQRTAWPQGKITLDRVGAFPRAGVIWAGCSARCTELENMVSQVRKALQANHLSFDEKPFQAHVTLFRKAQPMQAHIEPPIAWPMDRPRLYASISTLQGVEYRLIG